jgi:PIN domain nuclease of toxin-antitoxin system
MPSVLLDTHALIWLLAGAPMASNALSAIAAAQTQKALFVASISAWEASLAPQKATNQPDLLGLSVDAWFKLGVRRAGARTIPLTHHVALEAARVPAIHGSGDPGDCFLIATARVKRLSLITRDRKILAFARSNPAYLHVVAC